MELLEQNLTKDRVVNYTTVGIHKDDLLLEIDSHSIKNTARRGNKIFSYSS